MDGPKFAIFAAMNAFSFLGRAVQSALGSVALLALSACASPKITPLFEAQSEGKTLLVQKSEEQKWSTVNYATLLTFDRKAPLVLDTTATNQSLPYDDAVYGQTPFEKFDVKPQIYDSGGRNYPKLLVVLYVDPALYSAAEFGALARCLRTHGAAMSKAMESAQNLPKYQIVGMVFGRADDFVERFIRNPKDRFEVRADGTVTRIQNDAHGIKGMEQSSGGGLSNVEAKRVIRITDTKQISLKELENYKNPQGQSLPQRFEIKVEGAKAKISLD